MKKEISETLEVIANGGESETREERLEEVDPNTAAG